jgi:hypothetical protein
MLHESNFLFIKDNAPATAPSEKIAPGNTTLFVPIIQNFFTFIF